MLVKPTIEELLPKVDNRYVLAMLVAKRARQLVDGAQPLTYSDSPNLVTVACEEVGDDKVACVRGLVDAHVPLRPEIEVARLAALTAEEQAGTAEAIKEELDRVTSKSVLVADDAALAAENLLKKEMTSPSAAGNQSSLGVGTLASNDNSLGSKQSAQSDEGFPLKLAPPVEATDYVEQNFTNDVEGKE